jgi:2-dehydro-3-deoxygluconokinase
MITQNQLPFYVGGAEANVATALALWNIPSAYLTALPDNLIANQLVNYLQNQKISTSNIVYQGDRIGLYYLPKARTLKIQVLFMTAATPLCKIKAG